VGGGWLDLWTDVSVGEWLYEWIFRYVGGGRESV